MGTVNRRRRQKLQQQANNQATVSTTPKISPPAKALAEEHGIDWTVLTGTSATGMITIADVQAKIKELSATAAADQTPLLDLTDTDNPEAKGVKGNTAILPQ